MMKKLFLALALVLTSMAVQAQHTKSIRLTADDGTVVTLNLSRSLVIRFNAENLIASDGEQTLTVSIDKVKMEYSTESTATGIDTPTMPSHCLKDGTVVFQGLKPGEPVCVYSADGKLLATLPADESGSNVCVCLSAMPKGIYIIQAGKHSMKYVNR